MKKFFLVVLLLGLSEVLGWDAVAVGDKPRKNHVPGKTKQKFVQQQVKKGQPRQKASGPGKKKRGKADAAPAFSPGWWFHDFMSVWGLLFLGFGLSRWALKSFEASGAEIPQEGISQKWEAPAKQKIQYADKVLDQRVKASGANVDQDTSQNGEKDQQDTVLDPRGDASGANVDQDTSQNREKEQQDTVLDPRGDASGEGATQESDPFCNGTFYCDLIYLFQNINIFKRTLKKRKENDYIEKVVRKKISEVSAQ